MAGQLAKPVMSDVHFEDQATGEVSTDVAWTGQANHVDLTTIRIRRIARTDGLATPAPLQIDVESWDESTTLATEGSFQYIDTEMAATVAQMADSGAIMIDDDTLTNAFFANKVVWVTARLEV